jgi:CubicO group peptidase (beta-lactamase class C family)
LIQGHVEARYWPVARALARQIRRHGGGSAVCVYHHGHKVVDVWGGTRDELSRPWQADTMAMSFSTSKGVVATLVHLLADRGQLDYDDPISKHWPEFAQNGKGRITVRDVLSHRSGLPQIRPLLDRPDRILDWEYMVQALERARPRLRPGGASAYHAFTFGWLAGELVQRVTGRSLPELLDSELVGPLGLDGLYIGAPVRAKRRAATLLSLPMGQGLASRLFTSRGVAAGLGRMYRAAGIPLDPLLVQDSLVPAQDASVLFGPDILDTPVPAANGLFTARSLARMYAVLSCGGVLDGRRLLSLRTVRRAGEVQTRERDRVLQLPMHWRLGYHSAFTLAGRMATGFGHFGYGGSGAWADPRRGLSMAMITNRVGGGPFGDVRIAELGAATVLCARAS